MTTSEGPLNYQHLTYLFMCTDPVHVGTGGYRLGRVDNSIVREPGTNVPKIPGTSLHGAARTYAASIYQQISCSGQGKEASAVSEDDAPLTGTETSTENTIMPAERAAGHCGSCPVCYTFGFSKNGSRQEAYSGTINVFDAQIMLFPVHSMAGPVWITTNKLLKQIAHETASLREPENQDTVITLFDHQEDFLNLGWVVLHVTKISTHNSLNIPELPEPLKHKIVIVHEAIFSHIVNSNLEVRTSVAIDPQRGAAEDKALFTYEALPRSTVLAADIVIDDYRKCFPATEKTAKNNQLPNNDKWISPKDVLDAALRLIEWLGVGGMGTRGFGRMVVLGEPTPANYNTEVQ